MLNEKNQVKSGQYRYGQIHVLADVAVRARSRSREEASNQGWSPRMSRWRGALYGCRFPLRYEWNVLQSPERSSSVGTGRRPESATRRGNAGTASCRAEIRVRWGGMFFAFPE